MSIIQQLEDLKEWSKDSTRYERRLNFRGGQLVQPGPGRQGYSGNQIYNPQWYKAQKKLDQSRIANPSDEAIAEINKIFDEVTFKESDVMGKKVKHLPKEITIQKLAKKVKTKGYTRPSVSQELLKRVLEKKGNLTYDNYRTNKIVTVLNDVLTKNKGNTLYIKPSAALELLPEFGVKHSKGGGGNPIIKTYRNYIAGGERIGERAGIVVPEEIGGRKTADIVTDLDRNFLDVTGGRSTGNMKILNEVRLLDQLANENPKASAVQLKELFEEAGGTKFRERLRYLMPAKAGQVMKGSGPLILEAVKEGSISNSKPQSLVKSYSTYVKDFNQARFMLAWNENIKKNPEQAYRYTKAYNLLQKSNLERLGISGVGEHALPRSAIKTANAHPDTLLKIDAFIDPELNNWKAKNFDEAIFSPNRLADKYNKATDPKVKAALQEEIMQRLDFMKKRAPELMEKVTFDFSGGKFTASSSTATLDVADDVAMKGLFEKGNRINQKFITEMPDAVKLTSTGRIASIDDKFIKPTKDFLKLAPPKSTAKTIPANFAAQFDDAVKSGKFKGARNFLKGELWFAALDYINSRTKGQSHEKALGKAKEMALWGMKDLGADEKALIKHATEQGASEEEVGALRNYLNYMKKYKTYERANKMLEYTKKNLNAGAGTDDYMDVSTTWDDVTDAAQNLKLREGELENLYNIYTEGTGNMQLGSNMLDKYMKSLAAEEWNKTAGTIID